MTITAYSDHANLALAAYSSLSPEGELQPQLNNKDFTKISAAKFAATWDLVDQYFNGYTGLPASVFKNRLTGEVTLSIAGTDDIEDYLTDIISVAGVGYETLQIQYVELKTEVLEWMAAGVLSPTFSVVGHSLGGFLARGLTVDFPGNVTHTYTYNAPGFGGALVELGTMLGNVINIPIDGSPFALPNHSLLKLVDSLATLSAISGLFPNLSKTSLTTLFKQVTNGEPVAAQSLSNLAGCFRKQFLPVHRLEECLV